MEQQQAFQTGLFIGQALIYIVIGIGLFLGLKHILKKKDNSSNSGEITTQHSSKFNKALKFLTIAIVAIMVLSVVVYLNDNSSVDSKGWTDTSKASFKKGILNSCGSGGTKVCTCVADYLINKYTLDELEGWQQQYKETGNPPQKLKEATNACSIK